MRDAVRPVGVLDFHQRRNGNHLPGGIADLQFADVILVAAELLVRLDHDLVSAPEAVEVVHIKRAEIDLEGGVELLQIDALGLGFDLVHIGEELGHIDLEGGVGLAEDLGLGAGFAKDFLGDAVEFGITKVVAVLDLQAEAATGAQSVDGRGRNHQHQGVGNFGEQTLLDRGGDFRSAGAGGFALLEIIEGDEGDPGVGTGGEAIDGKSREGDGVHHAGRFLGDFSHPLDDLGGALDGGAVLELSEGNEILFVLLGNESGGHLGEHDAGEPDQSEIADDDDEGDAEEAADGPAVKVGGGIEETVEQFEEPPQEPIQGPRHQILLRAMGLEQNGAERGG